MRYWEGFLVGALVWVPLGRLWMARKMARLVEDLRRDVQWAMNQAHDRDFPPGDPS